jgi:hypothetical protein
MTKMNHKTIKVKLELVHKDYRIASLTNAVTIDALVDGKTTELRIRDFVNERDAKLIAADRRYDVTVTPAK